MERQIPRQMLSLVATNNYNFRASNEFSLERHRMAVQWYYKNGESVCGPVSPEILKYLAKSGRLTKETRVRHSKLPKWVRAGRVQGLFEEISSLEESDVSPKHVNDQPSPLLDLPESSAADTPPLTTGKAPAINEKFGVGLVAVAVLVPAFFFLVNSKATTGGDSPGASWLPERHSGVSREDVRKTLRDMEAEVPNTLNAMERELPNTMADIERQMLRDAHKYGISDSEVRSQVREMQEGARQQIRGMDSEVRREIRGMEDDVMREMRRIERGY